MQGPYAWGDPDFLETDTGLLSQTESESEFAMWAVMGGPMIVATDVRNMSAWKTSVLMNKDIIAVNQARRGGGAVGRRAQRVCRGG